MELDNGGEAYASDSTNSVACGEKYDSLSLYAGRGQGRGCIFIVAKFAETLSPALPLGYKGEGVCTCNRAPRFTDPDPRNDCFHPRQRAAAARSHHHGSRGCAWRQSFFATSNVASADDCDCDLSGEFPKFTCNQGSSRAIFEYDFQLPIEMTQFPTFVLKYRGQNIDTNNSWTCVWIKEGERRDLSADRFRQAHVRRQGT